MRNSKGKTDIVFGAVAGAILMALVIIIVFTLKTGIAGALLVLLIVAVAMLFGWTIGMNQRIERRNMYSYLSGYREGLKKHTTVIKHPNCRCTFTVDERVGESLPDSQ